MVWLIFIYLSPWSPFAHYRFYSSCVQTVCSSMILCAFFYWCHCMCCFLHTWKASLSLLALPLRLVHGSGCSGNHSLQKGFSKSLGPGNDASLIWPHDTWDWSLVQQSQDPYLPTLSESQRSGAVCCPCFFSARFLAQRKVLTKVWNWTNPWKNISVFLISYS